MNMPSNADAADQEDENRAVQPRDPEEKAAEDAALSHVESDTSPYGKSLQGKQVSHSVEGVDREGDEFRVRLAYQPAGRFSGKPGQEVVRVDSSGQVIGRDIARRPKAGMPWALMALAALSVAAAAVLVPWILNSANEAGDPLYKAGRVLWLRASPPEFRDEIQYSATGPEGNASNWRIADPGEGNKFAVVPVTVSNQQSQQVSLNVDEESADIDTESHGPANPINVVERSVRMDGPIDDQYRYPDFIGVWGDVTLRAGEQLTGMMVFEVPEDAVVTEFTWRATDTILIRFPEHLR